MPDDDLPPAPATQQRILANAARRFDAVALEDLLAFLTPARLAAETSAGDASVSARTARREHPDARSLAEAMLAELGRTFRTPETVPPDGTLRDRLFATVRGTLTEPETPELAGMERFWILATLAAGDGDRDALDAVRRVDDRTATALRAGFPGAAPHDLRWWRTVIPLVRDAALAERLMGLPRDDRAQQLMMVWAMFGYIHLKPGILRKEGRQPGGPWPDADPSATRRALVAAAFRALSEAKLSDLLLFLSPTALSDGQTSRWQVARAYRWDDGRFSRDALAYDLLLSVDRNLVYDTDRIVAATSDPREWLTARVADVTPGMSDAPWGPMRDRLLWLMTVVAGTDPLWGDLRRRIWRYEQETKHDDAGLADVPEAARHVVAAGLDETTALKDAWRLRLRYRATDDPLAVLMLMASIERWASEEADALREPGEDGPDDGSDRVRS